MRRALLILVLGVLLQQPGAPTWAGETPRIPDVVPDPRGYYGSGSSVDAVRPAAPPPAAALAEPLICFGFSADPFCQTGWGWQWFGVRVVNGVITFRAWSNLFNDPSPCPLTFTFHFGDGTSETAPGSSTDAASFVSVTHKYAQGGVYTVTITASSSIGTLDCTMTTLSISSCWQDGVLCYQGDNLFWNRPPPQTFGALDMDPPVKVNQTLFASGHSRIEYTYDGTGCTGSTFKPGGTLYVPGVIGDTVLFESAPALTANWNQGEFRPVTAPMTLFGWAPGGLPLWVGAEPIKMQAASLQLQPIAIIGVPVYGELARFSSTWRLAAGSDAVLVGFALNSGEITPSITLGGLELNYDPPPADVLDLKMSVQFPFCSQPGLSLAYQRAPCGRNMADLSLGGFFTSIPVVNVYGVVLSLSGVHGRQDHVCDGQRRVTTLSGSLDASVGGVSIPAEFFTIEDVGLEWQDPLDFRILGGTAKVLGYQIAEVKGYIRAATPPYGVTMNGTVNVADMFRGRAQETHILSLLKVKGTIAGSVNLPDFQCGLLETTCNALHALAVAALGKLPYDSPGHSVYVDGNFSQKTNSILSFFIAELSLRNTTLVVELQRRGTSTSLLVGTNMEDLFEVSLPVRATTAGSAVQRSVAVPADLPGIVFAAVGTTGAPPIVSLRTPDGRILTPQAPGIATFSVSAADRTALIELAYPAPGTWTLSAEGLPADDVTLLALAPKVKPLVAVTRLERSGDVVQLEATVDPPSATTSVQLYFGASAAGGIGEPIGEASSAASGSVSATWDVSGLPPGTYYVFAEASEEGLVPVTAYAATPVTIAGTTSLDAPTALAGTRDATTASLTWTPATALDVVAHAVLYTDQPSVAGYPYSLAPSLPGQTSIDSLEPAKSYRFAVVAVDGQGAYGPPSNELVLEGTGAACSLTCGATVPASAAHLESVAFQGTVTAGSCESPALVEWTFGDGATATGSTSRHAYATAGSYPWRLSAHSDTVSCESSGMITVTSADPSPRRRLHRHLDSHP